MVLSLKDLCFCYITKNVSIIPDKHFNNLNPALNEILVEKIINFNVQTEPNINFHSNKISWQKLNRLLIDSSVQLNDSILNKICKLMTQQIASLLIRKCHNITDNGLSEFLKSFVNCLENIVINTINIKLTKSLSSIRSFKLTIVDLSYCPEVLDNDLWLLCKNNSSIKALRLAHCIKLTNSGILTSLNMIKSLENLDIEGIRDTGPGFYDSFIGSKPLKNLNKLSFCGSNELNSKEMKILFQNVKNLTELNIYFSNSCSNINRLTILNSIDHPLYTLPHSLVTLSFYRPKISDANVLVNGLKRLKCLKNLSLFCVECLNDDYLIEIIKSIGNGLNILKLGGYISLPDRLGDKSIEFVSQHCKDLRILSFELFSSSANLSSLETLFKNQNTALKLENFNFSACRAINRDLIVKLGLYCKNVKKLDLSGLDQIVDDEVIEVLANNLKNLESIDLKACSKCTDDSVFALATNCKFKCLVLSGLFKLTDRSVYTIANNLGNCLDELYLVGCFKLTHSAVLYLLNHCAKKIHFQPNIFKL